jgi:hypothetical protein
MSDLQAAIDVCNSVQKDRLTKLVGVFVDAFVIAEGHASAAAQRQSAAERFLAGLRVNGEAHGAALELVGQAYPET